MSFNTRETRRSRIDFKKDKGLTEQSHKDSCDIRNIMRKYEKTGVLDHNAKHAGRYMDMPTPVDFKEAMDIIASANSMFESVPAEIRADFNNNPATFLAFMQNAENREKIKEYGFDVSHIPEPAVKAAENPTEVGEVTASPAEGGSTEPAPQ